MKSVVTGSYQCLSCQRLMRLVEVDGEKAVECPMDNVCCRSQAKAYYGDEESKFYKVPVLDLPEIENPRNIER